ncbi:hypothetical protein A1O1_00208 [Capronia coronata CBS 617.96]|uniref:Uncharacterized protein n=1 Tax=Capronia coronata CBS 617.96 TaxID=1182541 RepID=W9YZH2_9EURO|nr:uncharacterized protein A1O1_00208 [Capronia coronata CBS 617.96]EXJ95090.1 hypothetical protein A1O1_00208 [Capronia coronata CBS 617.96]
MPNKKSKSSGSKGRAPASGTPQIPASDSPTQTKVPAPTTTSASTEDFKAKNARAKALIMSTLVPGSEPWKIAEPLELASDIWKALEEKYAPKDGTSRSSGKKNTGARDKNENEKKPSSSVSSSDFMGDWVEGKPLDKYLDLYKSDILAKAKSDLGIANVEAIPHTPKSMKQLPIPDHVLDEMRAALFPNGPPEPPKPRATTVPPASTPAAAPSAVSSTTSSQWVASPVRHDSYLSESQALAFASYDLERKKQIQVAATKVLMQKLPTRDLRLLWAVLYGGDDSPWPGSWSTVIPGVTQAAAQLKDFEV